MLEKISQKRLLIIHSYSSLLLFWSVTVTTNFLLIYSCEFFELGRSEGTIGLFFVDPPSMDTGGSCIEINADEFQAMNIDDKAWVTARVCACMGLVFGFILSVLVLFKQCLFPLPCTQLLVDLSSMTIQVSLALVYFMWKSNACDLYQCNYGQGGTYLILTQIFWLAAGCFTRCMRGGRYERRDEIAAKKAQAAAEKKQKEAEDQLAKREAEVAAKERELGGGHDDV